MASNANSRALPASHLAEALLAVLTLPGEVPLAAVLLDGQIDATARTDVEALAAWLISRGLARLTDESIARLPGLVAEFLDRIENYRPPVRPTEFDRKAAAMARVAAATEEKQITRMIWKLVSALEAAFGIARDDSLVLVLGDGHEGDNRQALFTWVRRELATLQVDTAASYLSALSDRLGRQLRNWTEERIYL
jgi:hypothetical protein